MSIGINGGTPTNYTTQGVGGADNNGQVQGGGPSQGPRGDTPLAGVGKESSGSQEVQVAGASLQGTDWNALINSMGALNLSVSTTAILTMLIEIMADMRQDARENGFEQTVNGLNFGLAASEDMKSAALKTMIGAGVSAGMQLAGSYTAMKSANASFTAPTSQAATALGNLSQAQSALGSAGGQLAGAGFTYAAGLDTASAEVNRAMASYSQALSQQESDFARTLAEAISKAMSSMGGVNQSEGRANSAIYGLNA